MNAMTDSGVMKHRLTVDEYYRMAEVGLLAPDARVELIDGEIIDMPPMGSLHGGTGDLLIYLFSKAVGDAALVSSQRTLVLGKYDAPEPDLMLLHPRADFYRRSHPTPAEIRLVVEISDSTWRYDREIKAPLYARHDISDFWIVNLRKQELVCFREPRRGEFAEVVTITNPGLVAVQSLGNVPVDLTGLFD
ncbi:Uma2 family endonuclease [Steroidobacter cummioxidans]|uniref:Uma2 family endonuclease n=1 Tax=Steroidobacter cummioxidans TaxID=1803913 RepID=UPI000E3147E7|nr:Uma2 family endonuclease [Steroidobacter cummioxidans]